MHRNVWIVTALDGDQHLQLLIIARLVFGGAQNSAEKKSILSGYDVVLTGK